MSCGIGKRRNNLFFGCSLLFMMFFAIFTSKVVKAETPVDLTGISVIVEESNHYGNIENSNALQLDNDSRFFVQGTGIGMKDVIKLNINLENAVGENHVPNFDRIAIAEPGFNMSSTGTVNYDTYYYEHDEWNQDNTTSNGNVACIHGKKIDVNNTMNCGDISASSEKLEANKDDGEKYIALFSLSGNTLTYAYTIRNEGYGLKQIHLYFYNSSNPILANNPHITVYIYVSKPISDFNDSGFTWIGSANTTCGTHNSNEDEYDTVTNNICVSYINRNSTNIDRELFVTIPKEVAYLHNVSNTSVVDTSIEDIKEQSIYAVNTFNNYNDDGDIQYYYYQFLFSAYTLDENGLSVEVSVEDMIKMDVDYDYKLLLVIDAYGKYKFYIKDFFGNSFESSSDVDVNDVSKRDILIDFVNADELSILDAELDFVDGNVVVEFFDKIDFSKMKNQTAIEIETFSKIKIDKGVWSCKGIDANDSKYADCVSIRKNPLDGADEIDASSGYWKVDYSLIGDSSENEITNSDDFKTLGTGWKQGEYSKGDINFNVEGNENRFELGVGENGRYRFYIIDKFGNSTDNYDEENDGTQENALKNPYVDITVLDIYAPSFQCVEEDESVGCGDQITIETYDYVNGGGEKNPLIDLISVWDNEDIYYNNKGNKYSYYESFLFELFNQLNMSLYDDTFSSVGKLENKGIKTGFECNGNECSTTYVDPYSELLSDRNESGNSVYEYDCIEDENGEMKCKTDNLHMFIIKNGVISLTSGLVQQVIISNDYDIESSNSFNSYLQINGENPTYNFVKSKGYIDIKFKDENICHIYSDLIEKDYKDCFLIINKYIDTVRDFSIEIVAYDNAGNTSASKEIKINVVDTTAPGYLKNFEARGENDKWTNKFNQSVCMIETGMQIPNKRDLIGCYLISNPINSDEYYFKDNDTTYEYEVEDEKQLYEISDYNPYFSSVEFYIDMSYGCDDNGENCIVDGVYEKLDDSIIKTLTRAGSYNLKIVIYDNWNPRNSLSVIVEFYVTPKILLIEPISGEKVYGDGDPNFDYCVYTINDNRVLGNLENYFNPDKIGEYYRSVYCTESNGKDKGSTILSNGNVFEGNLSRVESLWYNKNLETPIQIQNDFVGFYHIILGDLHIGDGEGNPVCSSYGCSNDYIIKMKPDLLSSEYQIGGEQTQNTDIENDNGYTESNINFAIKQTILTVAANGGSKTFGEQDSNSRNWNDTSAETNLGSLAYLNGYKIIDGLRYDDSNYVKRLITGVLRREFGEDVGKYKICNIMDSPNYSEESLLGNCNDEYESTTPTRYLVEGNIYNYEGYDNYNDGGDSGNAALFINVNGVVYDGNLLGKTLNQENRNYAIAYVPETYIINANELVVQPGINQGKEYSKTPHKDPIWQIVVYGEAIRKTSIGWRSSIRLASNIIEDFSGYTKSIDIPEVYTPSIDDYSEGNTYVGDSEVYYSKRKRTPDTPDVEYLYRVNVKLATETIDDVEYYTNVYEKKENYYCLKRVSEIAGELYVYAYGDYYQIDMNKLIYNNDKIENVMIYVRGHLVNEKYKLFMDGNGIAGNAKMFRTAGEAVGWYSFTDIDNNTDDFKIVTNSKSHCTITESSIIVDGEDGCRNYNLTFETSAPDSYKNDDNGNPENAEEVTKVTTFQEWIYTDDRKDESYKPDFMNACNVTEGNVYSSVCSLDVYDKVLFEIFKREIIISFDSSNYTFNYGQRYDYYKNVFEVNDNSEGDLFVCYNEEHLAVNCTSNVDYGITSGDSWTSIGLNFYMHSILSDQNSIFYDSDEDYPIPVDTYYIYASISSDAANNYKFTYLGGSLTINPKVVSIQLTSYTKEYDPISNNEIDFYYSYGLGTDYSSYTQYGESNRCMADSNYLSNSNDLISLDNCLGTDNVVGNNYGFQVEGLDFKDIIANNFVGRPIREVGENVGIYKIGMGSIGTKTYKLCDVIDYYNSNNEENDVILSECNENYNGNREVIKENISKGNYDISYSKSNNEGAYLFITPATITITVHEDQTKMYGCAYSQYVTSNSLNTAYDIVNGYEGCDSSIDSLDNSYAYEVSGDKDHGADYIVNDSENTSLDKYQNTSLEGSLYRVLYNSDNIFDYDNIFQNSKDGIYQGQSVGEYIITIGNLNSKLPDDYQMRCDIFNNPSVTGEENCRNYNLNYYGNSTSVSDINKQQQYTGQLTLEEGETYQTYNLNYVEDESGQYVLINGKYVSLSDGENDLSYVKYYVELDSLTRYKKVNNFEVYTGEINYEEIASNEEVYINVAEEGYKLLKNYQLVLENSTYYININNKKVPVSVITKYKKVSDVASYLEDNEGNYVVLGLGKNSRYVEIESLNKYYLGNDGYTLIKPDNYEGETYVLVYGSIANLTRYKLDVDQMYVINSEGSGEYIFVNGTYVLKSSIPSTIYSAMIAGENSVSRGSEDLNDIKFRVVAREVHVHAEYNVKYVGNEDVDEVITCKQIKSAYGLGNDDRDYCISDDDIIKLGSARYYAIDNSLAKYPWTEWMDKNLGKNDLDSVYYNDTQFDVLTGELERATGDIVGKYTYNFANINVNSGYSGANYIIKIATSTDWDNTFIESNGKYVSINRYVEENGRYSSQTGSETDNVNGYYIPYKDEYKSISLIDKYACKGEISDGICNEISEKINFWYLGFYAEDKSDRRLGQLAKWWQQPADEIYEFDGEKYSSSSIFEKPYYELKEIKNDDIDAIKDFYLELKREIYFEIIRRTIYLYAVDSSKIYGTQDKYGEFMVAICATDNGYTVDGSGVKCNDPDDIPLNQGLSDDHKDIFYRKVNDVQYMNQDAIKGGDGYIFVGTGVNSMKIYFKRSVGEDVGVYSITACATQTGITDCSDPTQEEKPDTPRELIADDYIIIEMPGTLTIETREITIVPDMNQGFMYGNYPHDGQIPSITYKEYFGYVDGDSMGSQGMINSGNSPTSSNIATCLINISGESVVCINDNQNIENRPEDFVFLDYTDEIIDRFSDSISMLIEDDSTDSLTNQGIVYELKYNNIYNDSYSSEADENRKALDRVCGELGSRYSRDVCNYIIVEGELTENSKWSSSTHTSELVRIIKSNVYIFDETTETYINDNELDSILTEDINEGYYLKIYDKYYPIKGDARYTYSYTLHTEGDYIKTCIDFNGDGRCEDETTTYYYKINSENRYSDEECTIRSGNGDYFKQGLSLCTPINNENKYKYDVKSELKGEFLEVIMGYDSLGLTHNYTIKSFVEDVEYNVSAAKLTVTPREEQYKIYGDADVELKFDVTTTYTVESTHSINATNIESINGEAVDSNGTIEVNENDVVTLIGFAYSENMNDSSLNYGKNTNCEKVSIDERATEEVSLDQDNIGDAMHFDKNYKYNEIINTSRILLGNLYIENYDQNVGFKNIVNGLIIAKNGFDEQNYESINFVENIKFKIIPRPIFVQIIEISKEYGQATDIVSCDVSDSDCSIQEYNGNRILHEDEEYLIYNYIVNQDSQLEGYDTSSINLPSSKAQDFSDSVYKDYIQVKEGFSELYYTSTGNEEKQGGVGMDSSTNDLQIVVERGNYKMNSSYEPVNDGKCLVKGEDYDEFTGKGCEDVGVYFTRFRGIKTNVEISDNMEDYYINGYWGYNPNYSIIVENGVDTSKDQVLNNSDIANNINVFGSTLIINKKLIEIVVETDDDGDGPNDVGEIYMIEQNMNVPELPVVDNDEEHHTTYTKITWYQQPNQVRTGDILEGVVAYCQDKVVLGNFNSLIDDVKSYTCTTGLIYHGSNSNDANSGPAVFDTSEEGYYAITRDPEQLYITHDNVIDGVEKGIYESSNYNTTFVNGVLIIERDETAPVIFAGSEFYAIEANEGVNVNIDDFGDNTDNNNLNALKDNKCSELDNKGYVNCGSAYFTTAIPIVDNKFKLNGYVYEIKDGNVTKVVDNASSKIEENHTFVISDTVYTIIKDGQNNLFITREHDNTSIDQSTLTKLLKWFNIMSHDPSVVRKGNNIGKRYDPSYYIAIDSHFNNRVVGSYTVYVYAMDNVGNISKATTVTLNVMDTTAPDVGTLNLYTGSINGDSHSSWSNNENGIWLSIIGGADNALEYLDIGDRILYSINQDKSFKVDENGAYMLNGTIVKINSLTQYYIQENKYYIVKPNSKVLDDSKVFVRINGEYKSLDSLTRYILNDDEYSVSVNGEYIILGEFYELPNERYNKTSKCETITSECTYIRLNHWDHYFSRDNGASWIKYDRDTTEGYLALGSDGKRLIMIKAVDKGINYDGEDSSTNTVIVGEKKYYLNTYYNNNDKTWYFDNPPAIEHNFNEFKSSENQYNVSQWAEKEVNEEEFRDRKYAYLDTQSPMISLDGYHISVYEYGCSDCVKGYSEEYAQTYDSYLLSLSLFGNRYDSNGNIVSNGNYIKISSRNENGVENVNLINIEGKIYKEFEGVCSNNEGKTIGENCYKLDSSGTFVHIGVNVEKNDYNIDDISAIIFEKIDKNSVIIEGENTIDFADSASDTEMLLSSTIYDISNFSGGVLENGKYKIEDLNYSNREIIIYLSVANPDDSTKGNSLTDLETGFNLFGNEENKELTNYRYIISYDEENKYSIRAQITSGSDDNINYIDLLVDNNYLIKNDIESISEAIAYIIPSGNEALKDKSYSGKDLIYSIHYCSIDKAGNKSETEVRGVIFSDFKETIEINTTDENGENVSLYNTYSIDVIQNSNVLSVLGNFSVTTNKSDSDPTLDKYLIQSIYYNDKLVSSNQKYDPNTLENLDTSTPGVYKIIYNTRRIYKGEVIMGNPFELVINVKPNVPEVASNKLDYKKIIIITFICANVIGLFVYMHALNKKRKFN